MPAPGETIDLLDPIADHPLNLGLRFCALGLDGLGGGALLYDLTNTIAAGSLASGTGWAATPNNLLGPSCTSTGHNVNLGATSTMFPSATDATILLLHRKQDTSNRVSASFGDSTSSGSTTRAGCHMPYSDGTVYFDWGGSTNGSTRCQVAITSDTNWHLWGFAVGGGLGMRIYRDGVLLASNAGTPSRSGGANWYLNAGNDAGGGDLADFGGVWVFDRALSVAQIDGWYEQYQRDFPDTLNRISSRVWSFGADQGGGGGGTAVPVFVHHLRMQGIA